MDRIEDIKMNELIDITQLQGYRMAVAGDGTMGVYKLLITFGADKI